ncbi:cytochrome P450 78A11 [Dioscorea cayenensis subsp. rotundata]|uniref:Cytochrome P450 78A11 n=1 Tax=Dioscorea cayennensis subsp. rotundata TaxID=55577 RepID=A0AB40B8I7_DIOCR|nr:cytochrome P450 78A11 [Dioscorea cayenensis subsp. rotundata]
MAATSGLSSCTDSTWWLFALPAFISSEAGFSGNALLLLSLFIAFFSTILLAWAFSPGGPAWSNGRSRRGPISIPGPRGLPILGSLLTLTRGLPHRSLAHLSRLHSATSLMAFSIGSTPAVVSSSPSTARELLTHPSLSDRPLKQSARELMFARAIGFAPSGSYWRLLRRIAASHLFSPRRVAAHELGRQFDCSVMLTSISAEQASCGSVLLRPFLQAAALNNIMGSVFGTRFDLTLETGDTKASHLQSLVREGFDLLGAFNWSDHLPWLTTFFDPSNIKQRCAILVPRVRSFVKDIIDDHKRSKPTAGDRTQVTDNADFVDVLLSLQGDEKLHEDDMIAILWEMIFRGTDTTALLTEWAMAELVLNPSVQARLRAEIDSVVGPDRVVTDADVARMPYLQAVVKEALRVHPPGPLLSWARLASEDVHLSNGMVVPAGTTTMVNMWAITHDPNVWAQPEEFKPERFLDADVDVRGGDLRLAPFGAGRRVCPGKNLGIVTVGLWIARLIHVYEWVPDQSAPVDLTEVLKLSCEMKTPLTAVALARN